MKHLFLIAAITWAAALPLATFIASQAHPPAALSLAGLAVYAAGSVICHQLPDRSFHLWSAQMPVCARCTGIYAGAAMMALVMVRGPRRRLPAAVLVRRWLAAAALPTVATLAAEWTTGQASNGVRAIAGLPLGAAVGWAIGAGLASPDRNRLPPSRESFGGPPSPCPPAREAPPRDLDNARRASSGGRSAGPREVN